MLRKHTHEARNLDKITSKLGVVLTGLIVLPGVAMAAPQAQGDSAFHKVWERTDYPVSTGMAQRSWMWGPGPNTTVTERLDESPGGMRQVQYYDKSRMELNDPRADASSPWYVTNGLLVVEMISGNMQVGNTRFEKRKPADVPVAGDTIGLGAAATAPTYAALGPVTSLEPGQNEAPSRLDQLVNATLGTDGSVGTLPPQPHSALPKIAYYEKTTGHNVPDVFWYFMNASGRVYQNGKYVEDKVFDWTYVLGYPITEPYWIDIRINNRPLKVMMQAFQRRVLTYNPANTPTWQVEMGNVGMQYYGWRYGENTPPAPAPTPGTIDLITRRFDLPEFLKSRQYSAISEPLYTVAKSDSEWQQLWSLHTAKFDAMIPAPAVNFGSEFVVAAFWGDRPSGCSKLDITAVQAAGGTIRVAVNQVTVQGECPQVITQPHDFEVVSRQGLSAGGYKVIFTGPGGAELNSADLKLP